ncbi:G-type lectin S-receptor-like serine/threonine-protein [Vigna angularis]|uniref:G-type lectin S-receptor-like serine/threonine-protein n=1 Tax=Phaseolus angularis TaxID=3914 RepID=A0A8T0K985_PHAAN|nr:G-type lectin S-receptor-like serine/threonine-protein [Vigna angularis]
MTGNANDALTPTSSIADGQELISPGQNFSLGFFTPGASKSRYIGIWYKNITPQTIVWVANRDIPLNDSRGNLTIAADGNIVLFDGAARTMILKIEFPELVIRQGTNITFRSGIWDGIRFNSDDWLSFMGITAFKPQLSVNSTVAVYWDEPGDRLSRYVMKDDGLLQRYIWDNKNFKWTLMHEARKDFCDNYGACGVNGICNMKDIPAYCNCLKGFTPHSPEDWDSFNWSGGCIRRTPLNCTQVDRFQKLSWVKLPMLLQFWTNESMNLEECKVECLKNCSCTAYANSALNEGPHGCLLWFGDLTDIRKLINEEGVQLDLYLRLAASEIEIRVLKLKHLLDSCEESTANASKRKNIALIISVPVALLLCSIHIQLRAQMIN